VADLWLAPYLPLREEAEVGPWRLVPFSTATSRHTRSRKVFNEVRRLQTAYRIKEGQIGAVVIPTEGRVGDDQPRELIRPFGHAILGAALDGNPALSDDSGEQIVTAENAAVYGHPLGEEGYVITVGALVRQLQAHYAEPGRRLPRIEPPRELFTPWQYHLDTEYAAALYELIAADGRRGRQLDQAIEWLGLAWANTAVVNEDARLLVLRSGFEALLGGDASTKRNRELLSKLLDEPDAQRTPRTWREQEKGPYELTDLEWWFQDYALLRNKIAHGDELADEDSVFEEGTRHLHRADEVLRRAIKRVVVNARDEPLLERSVGERRMAKALVEGGYFDDP
jgi:hypothetical protein